VPAFLHEPIATAMSQSMLLPAFVALLGVVVAIFLVGTPAKSEPDLSRTAPQDPGRRSRLTQS
jgi:hypothetical protein